MILWYGGGGDDGINGKRWQDRVRENKNEKLGQDKEGESLQSWER